MGQANTEINFVKIRLLLHLLAQLRQMLLGIAQLVVQQCPCYWVFLFINYDEGITIARTRRVHGTAYATSSAASASGLASTLFFSTISRARLR